MEEKYYAHSGGHAEEFQLLQDHANQVAELAGRFAAEVGYCNWGRAIAGMHDAGKASDAGQLRIRGEGSKVDHSTAGAKMAIQFYSFYGWLMAYALAGHHGGLMNGIAWSSGANDAASSFRTPLEIRLSKEVDPYDGFTNLVETGLVRLPALSDLEKPFACRKRASSDDEIRRREMSFGYCFLVKFLFSCLVDADYLDTEAFMTPEAALVRGSRQYATIEQLSQMLDGHMASLMAGAQKTIVNDARRSIYEDCVQSAQHETGLFTLTVPTGGGKTLSSMAFALKHARIWGLKRIIVAIPFTSIVEQTAEQYKRVFGEENVLEHHSNYDFGDLDDEERIAQRLAVQNWDAPIVVTTNVQLLESLYSNKPGKSRKVHNMANSVIVLDEAQTLPDSLLRPSLAVLEELVHGFGASVVLCTATQPALSNEWPFGSNSTEIISNRDCFDAAFGHRVRFEMMGKVDECDIVELLGRSRQALCIVGTKGEALRIYEDVVGSAAEYGELTRDSDPGYDGFFHLSAFMVPAHRSAVISAVRKRLRDGERCVVISTQLVEAGVDVDFPVVYREMAGIDSLVQAAGRCNREGRSEIGIVRVFDCVIDGEVSKTGAWLEEMKRICRDVIRENDDCIDDSLVEKFFEKRYGSADLDAAGIYQALSSGDIVKAQFKTIPFEQCAVDYRIIDDNTVPVFVPWGSEGRALLGKLLDSSVRSAFAASLQRFSVSVPLYLLREYESAGAVKAVPDSPFYVLNSDDGCVVRYRDDVGLLQPGKEVLSVLMS